jgi:hypothetical protein
MANSTASIFIKPTVAFNRGDTFVFRYCVCTADGAGTFQRRLTMTPNPKIGLVTLPEVITGNLAGKFGEISLYNQHTDFEFGSASDSYSTFPWVIACKPAIEPPCADVPLHEHFLYGLCNAGRAHAEALTARRAGKEIVSDYSSDSNPASGYYSDSSYEFEFGSDLDEPKSKNFTTEQPLSGLADLSSSLRRPKLSLYSRRSRIMTHGRHPDAYFQFNPRGTSKKSCKWRRKTFLKARSIHSCGGWRRWRWKRRRLKI